MYVQEFPEGTQQQAGADDKSERQRDLGCNQPAARATGTNGVVTTAPILLQGIGVDTRGLQRGNQAEDDAGKNSNAKRDEQHATVDAHSFSARQLLRKKP